LKNTLKYYAIYKPFQVLSQFSESEGKLTLKDFLNLPSDIYPVGRLDYDSEGLLILTNDNQFKTHLLDPNNQHERTYLVQVEGVPSESDIEKLRNSLLININGLKYRTKPARAQIIPESDLPPRNPPIRFRKNIPTTWIKLTLTEGKNRQVRKMTAAIGFPTLRLVRYSIGKLNLEYLLSKSIKNNELSNKISFSFAELKLKELI
jgi:23S rRNA pseudouridine2457 synthase